MKRTLKLNEFFARFANTPLEKRFNKLTFDAASPIQDMNLLQIYEALEFLESEIRPRWIRQNEILKAVSKFI